jgi:hypothetical protein
MALPYPVDLRLIAQRTRNDCGTIGVPFGDLRSFHHGNGVLALGDHPSNRLDIDWPLRLIDLLFPFKFVKHND